MTYVYITLSLIGVLLCYYAVKVMIETKGDKQKLKKYDKDKEFLKRVNEVKSQLLKEREDEKNLFANDIHDDVMGRLSQVVIEMAIKPSPTQQDIQAYSDKIKYSISSLRELIYEQSHKSLISDNLGWLFQELIETKKKTSPIKFHLHNRGPSKLFIFEKIMKIHIYRIIQELINNSIKHSSAANIDISLSWFETKLVITYKDDGVGISHQPGKDSFGVDGIKLRADALNATYEFKVPPQGMEFIITIPKHY